MQREIEEFDEIPRVHRNHRKVVIERISGKPSAILSSYSPILRNAVCDGLPTQPVERAPCCVFENSVRETRKDPQASVQRTLVCRSLLVYFHDLG